MKILHINTSELGGAAKAVLRLQEGLMKSNLHSQLLVLHAYREQAQQVHAYHETRVPLFRKILNSIAYRSDAYVKKMILNQKSDDYEVFSFPTTIYHLHQHPLIKEADLIHLHWVADFVDYSSFFKKINKPLVWTLHDLNPINGGFHYQGDFLQNQIDFYGLEKRIKRLKANALRQLPEMSVVSPSRWLYGQARKSEILGRFKHYHIPHGIDLETYKKIDQKAAREILNLPFHKKIVLFVADSIKSKRKGFQYLSEAVTYLDDEDILLLVVGKDTSASTTPFTQVLDFISDDRLLAIVYSAADVYVIPSLEDNLPNTVIEAMACETPVLGFEVGGIPDMVRPYQTGLLAHPRDAKDLAQKLHYMLEEEELRLLWGKNARLITEKEYSLELSATRYVQIYEALLNGHSIQQKNMQDFQTPRSVSG